MPGAIAGLQYTLCHRDRPRFSPSGAGAGYLRSSRHVLSRITEFIKEQDPDVVGLIEVDTGSIRTGMVNQADFIARSLGHYSTYECKYGVSSVNHLVPSCVNRPMHSCCAAGPGRAIPLLRHRNQAAHH